MRADAAHAEHAEGLAVKLHQHFARPCAAPHLAVDHRYLARDCQHQCKRMLGNGDRVDACRIADSDAAPRGRGEVDVIGAGAPD